MRWVVAVVGALALMATAWLGLRERLTRPVLRVGIQLRDGGVGDDAVMKGVALALDERDGRGGRFRVEVFPQLVHFSKTHHKMWMPGLDVPGERQDESGAPLIDPDLDAQAERILDWSKARGLRRVALPTSWRHSPTKVNANSSYASLGQRPSLGEALEKRMPASDLHWSQERDPERLIRWTLEARPDLVVLEDAPGLVAEIRAAGYGGALFISSFNQADLKGLDGCLAVLSPLKPTPPDFVRRHPHPFAYAGYRAALRFLDALDDGTPPEELCFPSIFDDLVDAPRVYELQNGRFVAKQDVGIRPLR